jgi:hypothetical protein
VLTQRGYNCYTAAKGEKGTRPESVLALAKIGNSLLIFRSRNAHRLRAEVDLFAVLLVNLWGSAAEAPEAYRRLRAVSALLLCKPVLQGASW